MRGCLDHAQNRVITKGVCDSIVLHAPLSFAKPREVHKRVGIEVGSAGVMLNRGHNDVDPIHLGDAWAGQKEVPGSDLTMRSRS